jgi:hypothetical protein
VSRTYNTMPAWVQAARRARVRLPADWREPILDPADSRLHPATRRALGRHYRREWLVGFVGDAPAYYGPWPPLGGKYEGVGVDARIANRRLRHRDRQALWMGRYDEAPPRHRHSAQCDRW